MTKKSIPQKALKVIQEAIKTGNFDWTSQTSIVIYTPLNEDFRYINVSFKATE